MDIIHGPDFPTGGLMFNEKEIREAYINGRGGILTRGVAEIEEGEGSGKRLGHRIIITEIPYQVNKAEMIEKIAELVRDKKMEGIRDIRDESDKDGLRIVIELKHDSYPQKVLNNLYKHTDLEKKFHLNMLALVDGIKPEILSIRGALEEYVKHREVIITRRTKFDLQKAKDRAHILEGLKKALDHIDAIITTIKKSSDREEAHAALMKKFDLSDPQASAILEMKLQSLAGLERQKIEDELKEKTARIKELEALLKDRRKILGVLKNELSTVRSAYGDERKTRLVKAAARELADEDLIPEEGAVIVLTKDGSIKRLKPESYRSQKRGGKGTIGMETREEDIVEHVLIANTHSDLLFFTNTGKVYQVKTYEIPEGSRTSKGKAIQNFLSLGPSESVTSILPSGKQEKKTQSFIVMVTKSGIIKKSVIGDFENIRRSGIVAIKLQKDDVLWWARCTTGKDDLVLVTKEGQAIRFAEKDVRPMGRAAGGVKGMRLKKNDIVVGMDVVVADKASEQFLLIVMEHGFGKKTSIKEYKRQKRGGSGIKTGKITSKNGSIVAAELISPEKEEIIAISRKGQVIRTELASISVLSRATQGVRIMKLEEGDKIASVTAF
jgi:DNA gyrase subunit A